MEDRETEILLNLYEKAKNECLRLKKKITNDSILLALIMVTTNNRYRILKDISISSAVFPIELIDRLLNKNYIRFTDDGTHVTLTTYGIWYIEKIKKEGALENLINGLEQEYFNKLFSKIKPLKAEEKTVLFALLAARTFSINSAVDLKKSERIKDGWKVIIDLTNNFLTKHKIIENKNIYGTVGNEHPVAALFRRRNDLTAKTRKIFSNQGDSIYFLDIFKEGKIDISGLDFLFKTIFEDKLSHDLMNEVYLFCCSISKGKSLDVFDKLEKHIFATHDYDELIKESLINIVFKS